ncbi:hypothetical protein HID58_002833 [Brassica napus]|uniref:F-box domain-containing protein n=3 Tax=Brassica TaxID=3705 RepID=A0ABQ8ENQ3_BRANA|nr:hypothetical protein HID58_002833 [Brassica napus]
MRDKIPSLFLSFSVPLPPVFLLKQYELSQRQAMTSRRTASRSMTSNHRNSLPIPDDLAVEIFSRLPSKAIGRCRCACKLLSSMLRRQDFTDLFLTKSSARPQILFACQDYHSNYIFFSSSPHPEEENSSYLFGCTNGFLYYGAKPVWKGRINPVIYNPLTGQSLTFPRLKLSKRFAVVESYLGYDPLSKEFKVFSYADSMVACFDLRDEKFSFVNFSRAMHGSTVLVNYNGKLGLLMSGDPPGVNISRASESFELWVLQDAEWSKHVYVLPPSWKDVVTETMRIAGIIVGTNEIVLVPGLQNVPSYVLYFNVERNTITKVRIQGMETFQGKRFNTYLNYVENVKLL